MPITHDQSHDSIPSNSGETGSGGNDRTLLVQGAILGGIVVLLLLASFFDVI
ncbi:MAG: hypothetical protein H8E39_07065 [Alphaproteobacteria bacterium]|nr:hypothetical protein [Alphaproteobacteria bacterium]